MRTFVILLTVLGLAAGCGKKESAGGGGSASGSASGTASGSAAPVAADAAVAETGSGSATETGSGSGSATADTGSGEQAPPAAGGGANRAGNCPSTVAASTTVATLDKDVIIVKVTSADKESTDAIRKRTEELLKEKVDRTGQSGTGHDQKGTHGGALGICPVYVPGNATATSATIDGGSEIRITVKDGKIEDLKKIIDERVPKAAEWVKAQVKDGPGGAGGTGGGAGDHGSNHSGDGDGKGKDGSGGGSGGGDGKGGGGGTGGGGGKGTGGGDGSGSATK
jgi:hypothetical protein